MTINLPFRTHASGQVRSGIARSAQLLIMIVLTLSSYAISGTVGATSVAVADPGLMWSSPAPINGLSASPDIGGIACPSASLCLAANEEGGGYILHSTDPAASNSLWTTTEIAGANIIFDPSCQSISLCAALTIDGILISTNPAEADPTWTLTAAGEHHYPVGVSCPLTSLCVAVNPDGEVLTSIDPTADDPVWKVVNIAPEGQATSLLNVSCSSKWLCVAVGDNGNVWISTNPAEESPTWTSYPGGSNFFGVSCFSESLCVAVGGEGHILASSDPATTSPAWHSTYPDGDNILEAVSCPSISLCVAVDNAGNIVTSPDPGAADPTWTVTNADGSGFMVGVSCPSSSLCFATDKHGDVLVGKPPYTLGVSLTGSGVGSVTGGGISCPSNCVGTYREGSLVTLSALPNGGSTFAGWSGACSGTGACSVILSADQSISANFIRTPPPETTIPPEGNSTVSNPLGVEAPSGADANGSATASGGGSAQINHGRTPRAPSKTTLVATFSPLFATRAALSGRTLGLLVGIPTLSGTARGATVAIRCMDECSYNLKLVRYILGRASSAFKLAHPLVLRRKTVIEIVVSQPGRLSRFVHYRFKRTKTGVVAYVASQGCLGATGSRQACT
jgi:hypothetical protein